MEKFSTEISDGHTWTYPPTGIGSKPDSPGKGAQRKLDPRPHVKKDHTQLVVCDLAVNPKLIEQDRRLVPIDPSHRPQRVPLAPAKFRRRPQLGRRWVSPQIRTHDGCSRSPERRLETQRLPMPSQSIAD